MQKDPESEVVSGDSGLQARGTCDLRAEGQDRAEAKALRRVSSKFILVMTVLAFAGWLWLKVGTFVETLFAR